MKSVRLDLAKPGDLIFVFHDNVSYVAIAVKDPTATEQLTLLLGPVSTKFPIVPNLTAFPGHCTVASFEKGYELVLPCEPKYWFETEPEDGPCLVLAEDKQYVRARYGYGGQQTYCYVEIKSGLLLMNRGNFAHPGRNNAFATEWRLTTNERPARTILAITPAQSH
jgi:hypothetical protein